jgi:RIO-like serine/threonine protein kinase
LKKLFFFPLAYLLLLFSYKISPFFLDPIAHLKVAVQSENFHLQKKMSHPAVSQHGNYVVKEAQGTVYSYFLLVREYVMLRAVQGFPGTPTLVGKPSLNSFCINYIPHIDPKKCKTEELILVKKRLFANLSNLHGAGIYHRDLHNMHNILITKDLYPVLIDYGRAIKLGFIMRPLLHNHFAHKDEMNILRFFHNLDPKSLSREEKERLSSYQSGRR